VKDLYQYRHSRVCIANEGEDWFVICGDGEGNTPHSKLSARLIARHAVLTEVAELNNRATSLREWADALSEDDFEEYYKEYVQE
jgi:hypothetical protein